MPFIGNQPALSYTSFAKQDFTTSATTSYTLDQPVANANELALFINFVRQEPTTAYSASGTSLTLTSATSASDDMYCVFLGKAVQTVNPPSGSVGLSQLSATGTPSSSTFLRGDNSWQSAGGANTPAFFAYRSGSNQSFTDDVNTVMQFNSEEFDTDNCYNTSTYRFTPNVAGKYLIGFSLDILGQQNQIINTSGYLNKNGSAHRFFAFYDTYPNNYGSRVGGKGDCIVEMNGSTDYVDVSIYVNVVGGTSAPYISDNSANNSEPRSFFYGYKIIE